MEAAIIIIAIYLFLALRTLLQLSAQVQPGLCEGSGFDRWISSSARQWESLGLVSSSCALPSPVLKFWSLEASADVAI